jgi:hypothetical protein
VQRRLSPSSTPLTIHSGWCSSPQLNREPRPRPISNESCGTKRIDVTSCRGRVFFLFLFMTHGAQGQENKKPSETFVIFVSSRPWDSRHCMVGR